MKRIKLLFIFALVGMLLIGCKSREARAQEQMDLGAKYMAELDYESVIVVLNKAIRIDPKNVEAYTMLAEVYEKSGRADEARETLEKALDIAGLSSKKEDEINKRLKNLEFLVMISKIPGEYDEPMVLELSNENDYDIYYTIETKENRLVATDLKYTEPILLDEDGKYILKAYTVDSDGKEHGEIEVKYTIKMLEEHKEKDSWENVGSIYRYRGKGGKIVTGWQEIDEDWYYFTDNGNMATGILDIDGKKYYFGEDGLMLTGWQNIEGKWYYFAENGEMQTDQYIDGYYVGIDGVMTDIMQDPVPPSKIYTDQFSGIYDNRYKFYGYHGKEFFCLRSNGPVIDRGNYYEVQNVEFNFLTEDDEDAEDYYTEFITTIYIRKNAMVELRGDSTEYKTAEQCYMDYDGKFWRDTGGYSKDRKDVLGIVVSYADFEIGEDGYIIKLNDLYFHAD